MRIGCFTLNDPVPELNEPYVMACLRPWIDVNGVGSLVIGEAGDAAERHGDGGTVQARPLL